MNANIELWRFIFTIIVCLLHFNGAYFSGKSYFGGGYIAVEFFFILSGFLLIHSFENKNYKAGIRVSAFKYTVNRIKSLYPHYIFSFIVMFIYIMIDKKETIVGVLKEIFKCFWEISMLQMSGIKCKIYNFPTWYISVLIIIGYLIYYLLENHKKIFLELIAPTAILFIYGYYSINTRHIDVGSKVDFGIKSGLLRGFAGMSLGCLCYKVYKQNKLYIENKSISSDKLNIIKLLCFGLVITLATLKRHTENDFIMVVALAIGVTISFLTNESRNKSIDNILIFLGRLSYPIFLNHALLRILFLKYIPEKGNIMFFIFIIVTILYSYATDKIVRLSIKLIKNIFNESNVYITKNYT